MRFEIAPNTISATLVQTAPVLTAERCKNCCTHLDIVLEVVAGTLATAEQVPSVEGVVHVPANTTGGCRQIANTKLLPLQQGSMEVAQCKNDGPIFSLQKKAK